MSQEKHNKPSFKKWLDLLQQESWQLELIISGFAIYGLYQAIDPLTVAYVDAQSVGRTTQAIFIIGLRLAIVVCIINLLLHVVLRGLWVGSLGLRYVSGDIDFDKLKYSNRFDKFLRKRIKSFDHYIGNLENYCSILFAVAFLSIFYVLSLFIIIILITAGTGLMDDKDLPSWVEAIVISGIVITVLSLLITLLDFLTLGYLKKKKWLATIYFPFYRFYSLISLSFLYRPLVYNFLDNKLGRKVMLMFIPVYVFIMLISSWDYRNSDYIAPQRSSTFGFQGNNSPYQVYKKNYLDQLIEEEDRVRTAAIQSKRIGSNALELFIAFDAKIEENLVKLYPELKLRESSIGTVLNGVVNVDLGIQNEALEKLPLYLEYLDCMYRIKIDDDIYLNNQFLITSNSKNQIGFETLMDISMLEKGNHVLYITRKAIRNIGIPKEKRTDPTIKRKDTITIKDIAAIPFWYYPD